jgi:hypothetical protein
MGVINAKDWYGAIGLLPVFPYEARKRRFDTSSESRKKGSSEAAHDKATDGKIALLLLVANFEEASIRAFISK